MCEWRCFPLHLAVRHHPPSIIYDCGSEVYPTMQGTATPNGWCHCTVLLFSPPTVVLERTSSSLWRKSRWGRGWSPHSPGRNLPMSTTRSLSYQLSRRWSRLWWSDSTLTSMSHFHLLRTASISIKTHSIPTFKNRTFHSNFLKTHSIPFHSIWTRTSLLHAIPTTLLHISIESYTGSSWI